jgi:DNA polymerase III alpha subunit (gram-positive type)
VTGIPLAVLRPLLALSALTGTLVGLGRRRRSARRAVRLSEMEFVAIDLETTGLDPRRDRIVAMAAIPFGRGRPQPGAGFTRVVNPGQPIPAAAQAIHGIGDADVRDAPRVAAALPEFLTRCRDRVIVAHAADLDLAIINRAARAAGLNHLAEPALDIGLLANALLPSWWDLSLEGLGRLLGVETIGRHTAEGDALTAGAIFVRMLPFLAQRGILTLGGALRVQRQGPSLPGGPGATGGGLAGP